MRALRVVAAVLALAALTRTPAHACSCIIATPQTYLARSAAAFAGEARLVQPQGGGVVVVTFRVDRVYKGNLAQEVSVFTGVNVDSCGIAFIEKRAYTVFAPTSTKAGALVTGLCDGTAEGDTLTGTKVVREYASSVAPDPAPVLPVAAPAAAPDPSRTIPIAIAAFLACAVTVSILRRASAT